MGFTPSSGSANIGSRCFKCDRQGHITRECNVSVICHNCGLEGHFQASCPKVTYRQYVQKGQTCSYGVLREPLSFYFRWDNINQFLLPEGHLGLSRVLRLRDRVRVVVPSMGVGRYILVGVAISRATQLKLRHMLCLRHRRLLSLL